MTRFDQTQDPAQSVARWPADTSILDCDIVVIGAGFAGAVAARELTAAGLRVVVVEARERVGGRAYTVRLGESDVDAGGQTFHWLQPHIWAEFTRYGIEMYPWPTASVCHLLTEAGDLVRLPITEMSALLRHALEQLYADARQVFPQPYVPLSSPLVQEVDHLTIGDRLRDLRLSGISLDLIRAALQVNFNGPYEQGAYTQGLRRTALAMGEVKFLPDVVSYRPRGGMMPLVQRILDDSRATIRLGCRVEGITDGPESIRVCLAGGQTITAAWVISTIPYAVLGNVDVTPPLSPAKQAFMAAGQLTRGVMLWIRLAHPVEPFLAYAPGDRLLNFMRSDATSDEGMTCQAFGPDATKLNLADRVAVQRAVRQWLPDAEVKECVGHDWVHDNLSGQMWTMLKPGQLTGCHAALQAPAGRLLFAGTDTADGWAGYFDGAVESALRVACVIKASASQR